LDVREARTAVATRVYGRIQGEKAPKRSHDQPIVKGARKFQQVITTFVAP